MTYFRSQIYKSIRKVVSFKEKHKIFKNKFVFECINFYDNFGKLAKIILIIMTINQNMYFRNLLINFCEIS